jgi:hypothetical protein
MLDVPARRIRLLVLICAPAVAGFMPTPSAAEPKLADLSVSDLRTVIIRLDRGACFGSCPIYTLTISGNGDVVFEGEKFVKAIGRQSGHLPEKSIRRLLAAFEAADFLSIGDTLSGKKCACAFWTDFPTVVTELRVGEVTHRVERYAGCGCHADVLVALENQIDEIAGVSKWTGELKGGLFGTTRIR